MTISDNTTPHRSSNYDRDVRQTIPFYETMNRQVIDLVKSARPDVVCWLDTGCGTGYLAEIALPVFPRTRFILADPSEAMLQQARERLQSTRLEFLPPVKSQDLDVDVAVQVITAIQSHHYLQASERQRAVQSCYRILEPGGLFITFENVAPYTDQGLEICLKRWKRFQIAQGRAPSTVENHLKRFNTAYFPIPVGAHLALLKTAGFQVVELLWFAQMQAGFYAIK
jgi:tRNA (cmo5U34)-methyltransferase